MKQTPHERVDKSSQIPPPMGYYYYTPCTHCSMPSCCSICQSLISIVFSRPGAREGPVQRAARSGHAHRPSVLTARGARQRGARPYPPRVTGGHPGAQVRPEPRPCVQQAGSGVRLPPSLSQFCSLHEARCVDERDSRRPSGNHRLRGETILPNLFRLAIILFRQRRA